VSPASCFGACAIEDAGRYAHMLIRPDKVLYRVGSENRLGRGHPRAPEGRPRGRAADRAGQERWGRKVFRAVRRRGLFQSAEPNCPAHNGRARSGELEEYFHYRGFQALAKVTGRNDRQWSSRRSLAPKLRGRAAAGSHGEKWAMAVKAAEKTRYIICNAAKANPGAFMDAACWSPDP